VGDGGRRRPAPLGGASFGGDVDDTGWLLRGLTADGAARVLAVEVTAAAAEVARAHRLSPVAARVAAEGVVATALLSAHIKGDERLTLQLQGERPKVAFIGDIDADGNLRARLTPSALPRGADTALNGVMVAIKHDAMRELYRGASEVRGERLTDALSRHLRSSAQVPGALVAVVQADAAGVHFAGGLYVELLPHAEGGEALVEPEALLQGDARALVDAVGAGLGLPGVAIEVLDRRPITWRCSCGQERVESMLLALGPDELKAMREEDGHAEITCDFCRSTYRVEADALERLEAVARGS
jgi:molecular chaperone Hsp33